MIGALQRKRKMVIGNGMVAKGFQAYENDNATLVFASGVSNSGNLDEAAFRREKDLLQEIIHAHPEKKLIYFSTCSVYDASLRASAYVLHKLAMEALIEQHHDQYLIFRVSNIAGKTTNPHTVLNYFYTHIRDGLHFYLWKNAARNIIGMDDIFKICHTIIRENLWLNDIINVANPVNYPVAEIVEALEKFLHKKANYTLIDKGDSPQINLSKIKYLLSGPDYAFDAFYLQKLFQQYYSVT